MTAAPMMGAWRRRLPPALHERDFALFTVANLASSFAMNMAQVTIGWQVYAVHRSKLDLGLIGLVAFIPLAVLALPAGYLADASSARGSTSSPTSWTPE